MKAAFFSLATLAFTAFATPTVQDSSAVGAAVTDNAVVVDKRENQDASDIIKALTEGNKNIKDITGSINSTLSDVQSGNMSKDEAGAKAKDDLQDLLDQLAGILGQITQKAGIQTSTGEFQTILNEVKGLLNEVLSTVKTLLTMLGALPAVNSIVQSVLNLLSKLLVGLTTAVGTSLVPPLLAALSPLLVGLGTGLVGPLLTAVAGLVAGIAPPTGP